jgi:hypothetical protein
MVFPHNIHCHHELAMVLGMEWDRQSVDCTLQNLDHPLKSMSILMP